MANYPGTAFEHQAHVSANGHGRATIKYLTDSRGTILLEVCDECFFIAANCEHEKNTWNEEGTELRCNLCNKDVT